MITIKLEIASNGVIKTVADNNYNGAGSKHESKTVYSTDDDSGFEQRIKFIYEICDDLGINLGNKYDEETLDFEINWGRKYEPSLDQVKKLVKETTYELKELKRWKNELEQQIKAHELIEELSEVKDTDKDLPF
tara:strand:+ start:191 stop:592 length:402 start_codon:yes stop_codon:yes gene_type:complete